MNLGAPNFHFPASFSFNISLLLLELLEELSLPAEAQKRFYYIQ